MKDLGLVSEY